MQGALLGDLVVADDVDGDVVVDETFFAVEISGKAPYPIINGDNIRIETANQIIQCVQRRNFSTSRNVNVDPKGRHFVVRMTFRKRVNRDMTFVQMGVNVPPF